MPLPAMTHSSAFLLPASTTPPPNDAATTYALVVLNQRLPRFAPLLWARGDAPLLSLPPSLLPCLALAIASVLPARLMGSRRC